MAVAWVFAPPPAPLAILNAVSNVGAKAADTTTDAPGIAKILSAINR